MKRATGRPFKAGASGNPGGRPKTNPDLVKAFRERTPKALAAVDRTLNGFLAGGRGAPSAAVAIAAAELVLDRGWGTAPATIKVEASVSAMAVVSPPTITLIEALKCLEGLKAAGALDDDPAVPPT